MNERALFLSVGLWVTQKSYPAIPQTDKSLHISLLDIYVLGDTRAPEVLK
uniref:Uncharacterized protein n=1 Tax=Dulem virus 81 TaxID=3145792 RepID=A0AAU8B411_9VIRU